MTDLTLATPAQGAVRTWSDRRILFVTLALVALVSVIGAKFIAGEHPLSGDEVLAVFGADMLKLGHLAMPVPPEWREYLPALSHIYHWLASDHSAWTSSYLPGNSALRALFDLTIGAIWCSPVLAMVAVIATYGTARRLFPSHNSAAIASAIVLASSPQFLVNAMTPFAMTAHLAVNTVWLWLFVLNRPLTHMAAILLGFLGAGLHRYVFHPLFVAPFIVLLMFQRRWSIALIYCFSYMAIVIFWIKYPSFIFSADTLPNVGASSWLRQALNDQFDHSRLFFFLKLNIWNLYIGLSIPLLIFISIGIIPCWRADGIFRALLLGIPLSFMVLFGLIPNAGYTWGYRYLHGQLGSLALVAGMGWLSSDAKLKSKIMLTLYFIITLLFFISLINQLYMYSQPINKIMSELKSIDSDTVIIDDKNIYLGFDLIRNNPDLSNRPIFLRLSKLNDAQIAALCKKGSVRFFTANDAARHGQNPYTYQSRKIECPMP